MFWRSSSERAFWSSRYCVMARSLSSTFFCCLSSSCESHSRLATMFVRRSSMFC